MDRKSLTHTAPIPSTASETSGLHRTGRACLETPLIHGDLADMPHCFTHQPTPNVAHPQTQCSGNAPAVSCRSKFFLPLLVRELCTVFLLSFAAVRTVGQIGASKAAKATGSWRKDYAGGPSWPLQAPRDVVRAQAAPLLQTDPHPKAALLEVHACFARSWKLGIGVQAFQVREVDQSTPHLPVGIRAQRSHAEAGQVASQVWCARRTVALPLQI